MKSSIIFFLLLSFVSLYGESPVFKHLSINNGLISNKVRCAVQDSAGFMWIGTENGLSRYDGYSFLSFSLSSGDSIALPSDNILCLAVDPVSKLLWIGTTKGLCYFNHSTFDFHTDFLIPNGDVNISQGEIRFLFFDRFDKLWVGTASGAYYYKNPSSPPLSINLKE